MSSAPLLTVVTITLNDRDGFLRTAESLLRQAHLDKVEWLVVDGGSTDGTLEAAYDATGYERAPAIARVLEGPDGGIADAMIRGAAAATGEYLQYLNSGDRYHDSDVLGRVVPVLFSTSRSAGAPTGWLYGQCQVVDVAGRPVRPLHARRYSPLRHAYHVTRISHQAVFVRRGLFEDIGGFRPEFSTALDFDLLMRLGRSTRPVVLDEVLIDYLEGGASQVQFRRQMALASRARRDVLGLTDVRAAMDIMFSKAFVLYGIMKLRIKPWLVRMLGQRFLTWWGRRRVVGSPRMGPDAHE